MRTTLFLVAGLLLLAAASILAGLFSETYPGASRLAIGIFLGAWFIICALNMWAGVTHAGYSVGEELPIFLLLFCIPTAVALLLKWRYI
jgi:hypothetical protein